MTISRPLKMLLSVLSLGVAAAGVVLQNTDFFRGLMPAAAVCGRWRSISSGNVYDFQCRGGGAFDVVGPDATLVGDGMQSGHSVTVSVDIKIENQFRRALLTLTVTDPNTLTGTFTGKEAVEKGNVILTRL